MRLLRRLLGLTREERRLVVRATVLLSLVRLGVGRMAFTTLRRLVMGRWRPLGAGGRVDPALADRVVWAVDAVERRLPGSTTCLTRALTVQAMLARSGRPSRLQIGVIHGQQGRLDAHAWVECEGRVLVGGSASEIEQFTPLAAFDVEKAEVPLTPSAIQMLPGGR